MIYLSFVLTAFNEEEAIENAARQTLEALQGLPKIWELILVDNGSSDQTSHIMESLAQKEPRARVIHVKKNKGYGYGVRQGVQASEALYVAFGPADGQMEPQIIPAMLELLENKQANFLVAQRLTRQDPIARKIYSQIFNFLMRLLFNLRVLDINGEPKMTSRETWLRINPVSDGSFLDTELLLRANESGLIIKELPMHCPERIGGKSKVGFAMNFHFLKNIFLYRVTKKSWDVR